MIKITAKYNQKNNVFSVKYNDKNTFTLENIALIEFLCETILENDEKITMEEIFDLVKTIKNHKEVI